MKIIELFNRQNGRKFQSKYLPTKSSKASCFLLAGLVFCVYSLDIPAIAALLYSPLIIYVLQPLMWLGIAFTVWSFPRIRSKSKLRHSEFLNWWALIFAVIFITVSFLAGLIDGLGKSPYSHSLQGIIMNIMTVGSALIAKELIRNYLVNSLTKDENYVVFIIVALFMTLASISLNQFINLKGYEDTVKFAAQYFAPEFCHNLLATYLAFLGGPFPAIIYMGTIKAFYWLSPVLPSLKWINTALIGVLCPVFLLSIIQNIYLSEARLLKRNDKNRGNPLGWMITTVVSIGMVWFSVGVFSIFPSVIVTGSMEPMIKPGDVILVQKIRDAKGADNLRINEVIQFKTGNILICHRIIDIVEEKGKKSYRTKGDNNSRADTELVKPEQIKGEVIKVVPKVGWPTLLIKTDKDIALDKIEF